MKRVINIWGEVIREDLEMSDIVLDQTYIGNNHISPKYLENMVLVAKRKGRKNVVMSCKEYPGESFYIMPFMLEEVKDV